MGDPLATQAHLADAVDAEVTAGLALVARSAINHSIPQLLSEVLLGGPAVQLAGVLWGPRRSRGLIRNSQGRGYRGHQGDPSATHSSSRLGL
jgi:hypothetical protein